MKTNLYHNRALRRNYLLAGLIPCSREGPYRAPLAKTPFQPIAEKNTRDVISKTQYLKNKTHGLQYKTQKEYFSLV